MTSYKQKYAQTVMRSIQIYETQISSMFEFFHLIMKRFSVRWVCHAIWILVYSKRYCCTLGLEELVFSFNSSWDYWISEFWSKNMRIYVLLHLCAHYPLFLYKAKVRLAYHSIMSSSLVPRHSLYHINVLLQGTLHGQ